MVREPPSYFVDGEESDMDDEFRAAGDEQPQDSDSEMPPACESSEDEGQAQVTTNYDGGSSSDESDDRATSATTAGRHRARVVGSRGANNGDGAGEAAMP